MRERVIERYLVKLCKDYGYWCIKFPPLFLAGFPDRLILMPKTARHPAKAVFVELKARGQKPRPNQLRMLNRLAMMGFETYVLDSKEEVDAFMLL